MLLTMSIIIIYCKARDTFFKVSITKNNYRGTILEKRSNFLIILSVENDTIRSLLYDETIKQFAYIKVNTRVH